MFHVDQYDTVVHSHEYYFCVVRHRIYINRKFIDFRWKLNHNAMQYAMFHFGKHSSINIMIASSQSTIDLIRKFTWLVKAYVNQRTVVTFKERDRVEVGLMVRLNCCSVCENYDCQ